MNLEKFKELYTLNLEGQIKKDYKGLNYLSWATAYKLALTHDPGTTFKILENENGLPYFTDGKRYFVKTSVTMFDETKRMILPVMDNKHNAVSDPDSRDINDSIMRCLVKNLALFGLGLCLYVGEDIKHCDLKATEGEEKKAKAIKLIKNLENSAEDLEKQLKKYKKEKLEECTEDQLKFIYNSLKIKKGA